MTKTDLPKQINLAVAVNRIQAARRMVITTHARADGDAIGSVAGLQRVLRQQGKRVEAFIHEPLTPRYAFLTGAKELHVWKTARPPAATKLWHGRPARDSTGETPVPQASLQDAKILGVSATDQVGPTLADADLLMIVDTCAAAQLGDVADALSKTGVFKLAIDHHLTRDPVADALLLDERAAACAQIITRICERAGWSIDAEAATLLYMGLATDTGWFRFSNADADAFATAARLIDAGAKPNELYERLYLSDPEPRLRLIGQVLSSFELRADGRLAVVRLTRDMLARCRATSQMTEEIVNEPQRVGSVVVCLLLAEPQNDGEPIRVSIRSKRDVDVAAVARQLDGGGHARAAGARIPGTIESVYQQIVPLLENALRVRPKTHDDGPKPA